MSTEAHHTAAAEVGTTDAATGAPELNGSRLVDGALGPNVADTHVLSDVGNGQLLIARHGEQLRYVHPWNAWLVWDGKRWRTDDTGTPDALTKETLRWLAANANELTDGDRRRKLLRFAVDSERAGRVRGALEMARSEPGVPVVPDQLDTDPLVLNVANGIVDLRTGALGTHDRDLLISRLAPVPYDPDAQAPTWAAFLERILAGDPDLIRFVQRAVGYSLTGLTLEQVILILYGAGANGKTTFVNTLLALLGDYAQQAPAETFLDRRDGIPNDIARLRGARMVAAAELGEGRRLNEPLVKRMTGGDRIAARFMRAEWFEFVPQFTPWLATNHKPEIAGTDLGIWRRVRLVPFTVTIPEHERDPDLPARLLDELPGILTWAIQGCLDWQAHGLQTPDAVARATADYRAEMDVVGAFLDECCDLEPEARTRSSVLHARFEYWAKETGHEPLTTKALAIRLTERGYTKTKTKTGAFWNGIALRGGGDG